MLKMKEIAGLSEKEREAKLKELRRELVKANVTANKAYAKTKELKRAISRLYTFNSRKELKKN